MRVLFIDSYTVGFTAFSNRIQGTVMLLDQA